MIKVLSYRGVQPLELEVQKTQVVDRRERNAGSWAGNLLRCLIQGKRCSNNDRNQDGGTDEVSCHAHYPTTLWCDHHRGRACCSVSRMEKAWRSPPRDTRQGGSAGWLARSSLLSAEH